MAAGKPIICAVRGDVAKLVQSSQAGVVAYPENAESITHAIHYMHNLSVSERKTLGKNASLFYLANLSMEVGIRKFEELFFSIRQASHG